MDKWKISLRANRFKDLSDFDIILNINEGTLFYKDNKHLYKIISWKLNLGDAIAFNFSTIHGAPGNNSNNKRLNIEPNHNTVSSENVFQQLTN